MTRNVQAKRNCHIISDSSFGFPSSFGLRRSSFARCRLQCRSATWPRTSDSSRRYCQVVGVDFDARSDTTGRTHVRYGGTNCVFERSRRAVEIDNRQPAAHSRAPIIATGGIEAIRQIDGQFRRVLQDYREVICCHWLFSDPILSFHSILVRTPIDRTADSLRMRFGHARRRVHRSPASVAIMPSAIQYSPRVSPSTRFLQCPATFDRIFDSIADVLVLVVVHEAYIPPSSHAAGFSYFLSAGTDSNSMSISFSLERPFAWAA